GAPLHPPLYHPHAHQAPFTPNPEAQQELRNRIDEIDHQFITLLAKRNQLVASVADVKRSTGVPIRDPNREAALLRDRRGLAGDSDIRPEVIESLFRVILWASRDRQASLKAAVPTQIEPRTIAIIGGHGGMGRCLDQLFTMLGHNVLVADVDTKRTGVDIAAEADVVIIAVNIESTTDVIREIGPACRPDALLLDITSIKHEPVAAMLEASECSVIGTHPLFGPSLHSLQGQRIVLTPGRIVGDTDWLGWLQDMLKACGLTLLESTPEDHDRAMAIVQVLTHYSTEVLGRTMQKLDVSVQETLRFTSPIYHMELLMTARHFAQSADLYASIEMSNPNRDQVMQQFRDAAEELHVAIAGEDREAFRALFSEVESFFGDFSKTALEQSSFLIDRLVERN
ncbi:MAG: bifunctional chorismate mutase/prephenate dehydrogenase, partial [Planctomycetota bacterium]|nr:bifunctional chorismate mutase/prephenate dehydrogenase [Planctomycetota bacterium]